ncbi:MAG: hypothetical protein MJ041_01210 [Acidaminococcaceae bacterium]|nr:hypothetical protein [Acidaminococcaceae bacterium]
MKLFDEIKQTLAISAGLTAAIILACYLAFDVHIVNRVRGLLGLPMPMLVVMDEVPTPIYFKKVLPYAKKEGIPIGTFVREDGVKNWQVLSGKTIKESLQEGVEIVPVLKTLSKNDATLKKSSLLKAKIAKEKQFFAKAGLNTDYFGYPWIYKQAQLFRPHMPKYCKAGIFYCGGTNSYNVDPIKDKYMLGGHIAGGAKWSTNALAYIDSVNMSNSLGILVIRTWRGKEFTDQEFAAFKEALRYARGIGMKIVTLREAMGN